MGSAGGDDQHCKQCGHLWGITATPQQEGQGHKDPTGGTWCSAPPAAGGPPRAHPSATGWGTELTAPLQPPFTSPRFSEGRSQPCGDGIEPRSNSSHPQHLCGPSHPNQNCPEPLTNPIGCVRGMRGGCTPCDLHLYSLTLPGLSPRRPTTTEMQRDPRRAHRRCRAVTEHPARSPTATGRDESRRSRAPALRDGPRCPGRTNSDYLH